MDHLGDIPRLDVLELSSTFAEARELNWWFHAFDFHPNIGMVDTMPSTPTHTCTCIYIVLHIQYGHTCTFVLTTHVNIYIYSNIYIYVCRYAHIAHLAYIGIYWYTYMPLPSKGACHSTASGRGIRLATQWGILVPCSENGNNLRPLLKHSKII